MKESVVRGYRKMRYSFSSCSSLPCISLLLLEITYGSGGGGVYARMRGITPARPQFETRPLLLDVIEVPRPLNETGLYSREASIRGNTVYVYSTTPVYTRVKVVPDLDRENLRELVGGHEIESSDNVEGEADHVLFTTAIGQHQQTIKVRWRH